MYIYIILCIAIHIVHNMYDVRCSLCVAKQNAHNLCQKNKVLSVCAAGRAVYVRSTHCAQYVWHRALSRRAKQGAHNMCKTYRGCSLPVQNIHCARRYMMYVCMWYTIYMTYKCRTHHVKQPSTVCAQQFLAGCPCTREKFWRCPARSRHPDLCLIGKKIKKIGHVGGKRDVATSRTTRKSTFVPDQKKCDVLLYF